LRMRKMMIDRKESKFNEILLTKLKNMINYLKYINGQLKPF